MKLYDILIPFKASKDTVESILKRLTSVTGYVGELRLHECHECEDRYDIAADLAIVGADRDEYVGRIKKGKEVLDSIKFQLRSAPDPIGSFELGLLVKELEYILRTGHGKREGSK